jgi:hypothetical protein
MQSVNPLSENRFQNANADFGQDFSDSRKKFIGRSELLSLEAFLRCPNKKQEKVRGS